MQVAEVSEMQRARRRKNWEAKRQEERYFFRRCVSFEGI
jgi:hypothetical protein